MTWVQELSKTFLTTVCFCPMRGEKRKEKIFNRGFSYCTFCCWVHDFDVIFKESLNFKQSLTKGRSVQ